MIHRRNVLLLLGATTLGAVRSPFVFADSSGNAAASAAADPLFSDPYVDVEEWRDTPVRHRYVHGGFKGTEARFVFCFPPKEQYQGRFIQYVSPVPVSENDVLQGFWSQGIIPFALASGGYAVGTNQGGFGATATPGGKVDPTIAGYRVSAAAAQYSRKVAAEMYGPHRTYGYIFGGSGGAFRTIGSFENTTAWDGAVPFVIGSDMHIPYVYTVRAHATRLLRGKLESVVDAIEPGGSGDMYAGLDSEARAALIEATHFGLPPRAWWFELHGIMGLGAFPILFDHVKTSDPSYFKDFWIVPGYLGAEAPKSLLADRVQHHTTVVRVIMSDQAAASGLLPPGPPMAQVDADNAWRSLEHRMGGIVPVALELKEAPPSGDLRLFAVNVATGKAAGKSFQANQVKDRIVLLNVSALNKSTAQALDILPADEVVVDNSDFLAVQTYHRHQVPSREYHAWDQFRRPDGTPIYPQRPTLLGPQFNLSSAGALPKAKFAGKMIIVECLTDFDAFPWGADLYRERARQNLGPKYEDQLHVWFVENAAHGDAPRNFFTNLIGYLPVLQQALRDVAAWAERGVAPPATTKYRMVSDAQVEVAGVARGRLGVQPVVSLKANGSSRAQVAAGHSVSFEALIEAPPKAGKIVGAEWDFAGEGGAFPLKSEVQAAERVKVQATHVFEKPGTYFVMVRAALQRDGDPNTPFARIENLGRVRVIVT